MVEYPRAAHHINIHGWLGVVRRYLATEAVNKANMHYRTRLFFSVLWHVFWRLFRFFYHLLLNICRYRMVYGPDITTLLQTTAIRRLHYIFLKIVARLIDLSVVALFFEGGATLSSSRLVALTVCAELLSLLFNTLLFHLIHAQNNLIDGKGLHGPETPLNFQEEIALLHLSFPSHFFHLSLAS